MMLADLKKPFSSTAVHWRVGSTTRDKTKGMALAYIDARDVMDRFDEVCGPENWQDRYPSISGRIVCEIGLRVGDQWVWKSDGAGDTAVEKEKGGLSDAYKRAAVKWGVGRYLYSMPAPWVELDTYKDGNGNVKVKGFSKRALAELVGIHHRATSDPDHPAPQANDAPPLRSKANSRDDYARIQKLIDDAPDMAALVAVWAAEGPNIKTMERGFQDQITVRKDDRKHELTKQAA